MANADEVKTNANGDATAEETKECVKETTKTVKEETIEDTKEESNKEEPKESVKEEIKDAGKEEKKEPIVLTKDLEAKIVRQIEYYFGDINLPRDKFLQEQIAIDDGWVPISVLLTFNRLVTICHDANAIAEAMINADNDFIIVSDDRQKIRRNPEIPIPEYNDDRKKELMARTAYAKGFNQDITLEELMKFFEPYGPYESVHMRTYKDKILKKICFKGSVFIIFKNVEACKAFLDNDEIKYEDKVLECKWQKDYLEEKKKEREERQASRQKVRAEKTTEEGKEPKKHTFPKGVILHMTGFKDTTVRESIKKEIVAIFDKEPAYVTFDKGDTEGYLRFSEENEAVKFFEKLTDAKFTVDDAEITARVLEGEEEERFLTDLSQTISRMRNHNRNSGKNKNRKRKGGGDGGPRSKHSRK